MHLVLGEQKRRCLKFVLLLSSLSPFPSPSVAAAQATGTERLVKANCERVEPLAIGLLEKGGFVLQETKKCAYCFTGNTEHLRDARGKTMTAATVYRRYVDRKYRPHSNPVVWYTERQLKVSVKMRLEPSENACRIGLDFGYTFYGMQFIVALPVDGDWIHAESNSRLEAEYLDRLTDLSTEAKRQ